MSLKPTQRRAIRLASVAALVLTCLVADRPSSATASGGRIARVSAVEDWIIGSGWTVDNTVVLEIDYGGDGSVEHTTSSPICDGCNTPNLDFQFHGGFDVSPGDLVRLTELDHDTSDVVDVVTMTVQPVWIDGVDIPGSYAWGNGPANDQVVVTLLTRYFTQLGEWTTTTDAGGGWTFSFAEQGHSLASMSGGWITAQSVPVDGTSTYHAHAFVSPAITVAPSTGLRSGDLVTVTGIGFGANEDVSLRMGAGFIGGEAPETAMPVTADPSGAFQVQYSVARVIHAKADPFAEVYEWVDCAAIDPVTGNTPCFIATFYGTQGSYGYADVSFEQTWVTATVNTTGTVTRAGGTATVSGTVTCPALPYSQRTEQVVVSGSLIQRIDRRTLATGTFTVPAITCTGTAVTWRAEVLPTGNVPFGTGKAEARVTARIVTVGAYVPTATAPVTVVKLATAKVPRGVI